MQTELEATFIKINPSQYREKLKGLGAYLVQPETLMRRKVFDYPDNRLRKVGGWVRVRDEGKKITLSYKQLVDRSLHGTKETVVVVNDFNQTVELLKDIGLIEKSYQETKREVWQLNGCEITIDTWPWISPFTEIEGQNEDDIKECANKLGFNWDNALHGSVENIYQEEYGVTEDKINDWKRIVFEPVPEWLEAKRKK